MGNGVEKNWVRFRGIGRRKGSLRVCFGFDMVQERESCSEVYGGRIEGLFWGCRGGVWEGVREFVGFSGGFVVVVWRMQGLGCEGA